MRGITLIFLLTLWVGCSHKRTESVIDVTRLDITAIDEKFPLELAKIDLSRKDNIVHLNDQITSKIEQTIENYYTHDCLPDSLHTYKDTYINTIRLQDSLQTIFLVLLRHYPFEELRGEVLFYDNTKKEFADSVCDFKIYALFDFKNGRLEPTNFKTDFKIDTPEIQLIDFDKDGINDFKFTRLYHNGTFNTVRTAILTVKNSNFDTLDFKEKGLGYWAEK